MGCARKGSIYNAYYYYVWAIHHNIVWQTMLWLEIENSIQGKIETNLSAKSIILIPANIVTFPNLAAPENLFCVYVVEKLHSCVETGDACSEKCHNFKTQYYSEL